MASTVVHIADRAKHDEVVEQSHRTPTVLHVSNSSLPTCREFSPRYEQLAQRHASSGIAFAEMDFNAATSYLFKFSPNQLPVTVAMFGDRWAKTVMGADLKSIEESIELLRGEANRDA